MPFERYLQPPQHHRTQRQHDNAYYTHPAEALDHFNLDPSVFSNNVQFQMPQLILGPTLAPGGGAEVLPAGIVGHPTALTSTWLTSPSIPHYGDDYCLSSSGIAHPLILPSYGSPPPDRDSGVRPRNNSITAPSVPCTSPTPTIQSPPDSVYTFPMPPQQLAQSLMSPCLPLPVPSVHGLPVYSASGFDLLSVLARVAVRPNPKIALGPVDMTCSFTVVDTRRFDHPIVYASPSFCKLTGYSELEVIGKNCRFLQSPNGLIQKGEQRRHTAPDAVAHLRKSLVADKECQVSLINYRKNNSAFINLVTVIPIHGGAHNSPDETDEVVYHVGFQVDLTEQPNAILQRLRDGTYMVNYSNNVAYPAASTSKDWKANSAAMIGVSKQFRASLSDLDFINSIPLHISTTALSLNSSERNEKSDPYDGNRLLSLLLLEASPDFVHVLSLKGTFLYVAPSVQRVLGYQPEDLVGKSITDFCHTADTVPLMRELKESSSPGTVASPNTEDQSPLPSAAPRVVDLLFRMRTRSGAFLWVECRGRLHVEPGKGRKAIILSGRTRNMPSLEWGPIARAGGFTPSIRRPPSQMTSLSNGKSTSRPKDQEREVWGLLSTTGSFLFIGTAVRDVLGWGAGEVMGRTISDFVGGHDPQHARSIFEETLGLAFTDDRLEARSLSCEMKRKDGSHVPVEIFFYHPTDRDASSTAQSLYPQRISEHPLVCQIKVSNCPFDLTASMPLTSEHAHSVFEELDTSRGSSWQYELQQLKYANQRLTEELEELEASNEAPPPATSSREAVHTRHSFDASTPWAHHLQGMGHQVQLPLKRTWDGTVIGGGPT